MKTAIPALAVLPLWFLVTVCGPASIAVAGPNAGGVLIVHNIGLSTTDMEYGPPYGGTVPTSCTNVNTSGPWITDVVWKVYVAFPAGSSPRLAGLAVGEAYTASGAGYVKMLAAGLEDPGDLEVTQDGWPLSSGGSARISFPTGTLTALMDPVYWFIGYAYSATYAPVSWCLQPHSSQPSVFVDDAVPPNSDPIAGYGCLGFGAPGFAPCPSPTGSCCHPDGSCTYTIQELCVAPAVWQGAGTNCTLNSCASTPVLLESWAASSLAEGLQIRWEVPLGTTGALYRAWRDPAAGPQDLAPTPDAVLVSSAWIRVSAEGIIVILDREAPRGTSIRYFLETNAEGGAFIGPVAARWDPPPPVWSAEPNPFHGTTRFTRLGAGPARVDFFDPRGRLVRTLVRADGSAPLEWDGRDAAGRGAPAGVYLVKVTTPAGETSGRVVLAR